MIKTKASTFLGSAGFASLLLLSSCKSPSLSPTDGASEALDAQSAGGGGGFFASMTRQLVKKGHEHAKASFVEGLTNLGNNKSARDSLAKALCDRLPLADKTTCLQRLSVAGDLGTGVGKALTKDIAEAVEGVHSVVSNPEDAAHGIFEIGKQFAQDPSGTLSSYKDQALALRDDVVECWNSGTEGKGAVIGHAGLLIFPEAKGAEAMGALGAAGKAVKIGSRGAVVVTEIKNTRNDLCKTETDTGPDGETIVNSVLRVPAVINPEAAKAAIEVYLIAE